jgi:nitroreductase
MPLIDDSELATEVATLLRTRPATRSAGPGRMPAPEPGVAPSFPELGALAGRRNLSMLADVLDARRSVREFRDEPLPLADVQFVVDYAGAALQAWWPAAGRADRGLAVLAAAFDVTGLSRGIHAPDQEATLVAEPGWLPALRDIYAPAPVLLLICGDVSWACSEAGPGYGGLLTAAGALGYALWLAAISAGLAGSVYGGTCHDVTQAVSGYRPGLHHLFTFALGRPAAPVRLRAGTAGGRA